METNIHLRQVVEIARHTARFATLDLTYPASSELLDEVLRDAWIAVPSLRLRATIKPMNLVLHGIEVPQAEIERFCARNHVRKLSLFGRF